VARILAGHAGAPDKSNALGIGTGAKTLSVLASIDRTYQTLNSEGSKSAVV
jgi:hypothetical protein